MGSSNYAVHCAPLCAATAEPCRYLETQPPDLLVCTPGHSLKRAAFLFNRAWHVHKHSCNAKSKAGAESRGTGKAVQQTQYWHADKRGTMQAASSTSSVHKSRQQALWRNSTAHKSFCSTL